MLGRLVTVMAGGLLLAVAAGYGGTWDWRLSMLADLRLHLGALGAALGLAAAIFGNRRAMLAGAAAALAAAVGLGPVYDPPLRPGGGRAVTLLYANLHDSNPEPARLVAALKAADADILITSETRRSIAGLPGAADGLNGLYRHSVASPTTGTVLRTAIWSRFPLARGRLFLNNTVAPTGAAAVAELGGGLRLGLVGVHFSRAWEGLQQVQSEALGPIAASLGRPLVVAGDFNASPWAWVVGRAAEVTGTEVVGGYRVTWKGDYPTPLGPVPAPWGQQIDHVLVSPGLGIEEVRLVALPGSDHRGVLVRLRVEEP